MSSESPPAQMMLALRLREVYADLTNREISRLTGADHESIRRYLIGRNPPPVDFLIATIKLTGVDPGWLLLGTGPKLAREHRAELLRTATPTELALALGSVIEALLGLESPSSGGEKPELVLRPGMPAVPTTSYASTANAQPSHFPFINKRDASSRRPTLLDHCQAGL